MNMCVSLCSYMCVCVCVCVCMHEYLNTYIYTSTPFSIILTSLLYSSLTFHLNLFSVFYSPHLSSPLILSCSSTHQWHYVSSWQTLYEETQTRQRAPVRLPYVRATYILVYCVQSFCNFVHNCMYVSTLYVLILYVLTLYILTLYVPTLYVLTLYVLTGAGLKARQTNSFTLKKLKCGTWLTHVLH